MPAPKRKPAKKKLPPLPRWESYNLLRLWREHRGLSQEEAADEIADTGRARTDYSKLGKIERGIVRYTPEILEAAALVYGCRPGDLLNHDPNSPEWSIVAACRGLSPENRAKVLERLRGYIEGLSAAEAAE